MQKNIKSLILFSMIVVSVFFVFSALPMQTACAQIQAGDISLSINPKYPRANETVKASLSTYTTDLNKAMISWLLNGTMVISGVGKKDFSFNTGNSGIQTSIEAQIDISDGSSVNKKMIITPADIDMLWEAYDAYVPPFYKGKALAPPEGVIKVVAISNSSSSQGLIYNWKQDDNNKPNSSGYGKNSYSFKNSYLETSNTIETTVSSLLGANVGSGKITVRPESPKIIFYKKDPILGTKWEKSLADKFTINSSGQTIVAEPYFFSPKNLNSSNLKFKWSLGGSEINTPAIKNEISIKPEAGQTGTSSIQLSINNIKTLFLSMDKTLNVSF